MVSLPNHPFTMKIKKCGFTPQPKLQHQDLPKVLPLLDWPLPTPQSQPGRKIPKPESVDLMGEDREGCFGKDPRHTNASWGSVFGCYILGGPKYRILSRWDWMCREKLEVVCVFWGKHFFRGPKISEWMWCCLKKKIKKTLNFQKAQQVKLKTSNKNPRLSHFLWNKGAGVSSTRTLENMLSSENIAISFLSRSKCQGVKMSQKSHPKLCFETKEALIANS